MAIKNKKAPVHLQLFQEVASSLSTFTSTGTSLSLKWTDINLMD